MLSSVYKHYYHRAGFGIGIAELEKGDSTPLPQLVEEALQVGIQPIDPQRVPSVGSPTMAASFLEEAENPRFQRIENASTQLDNLRFEWFEQMRSSKTCLREKMTLFWHGHFACQCLQRVTARAYLDTLRRNALGDFRSMLHDVAKTPAMILFLNNQQNRKDHPNENFARELMELFTLGLGAYSEYDVKEAARAFTGWSSDESGGFIFRKNNHDAGSKTFLNKRGRFTGEDVIEIILEQPSTALHLARQLYQFFINDLIDEKKVQIIAAEIKGNDYEMAPVMEFILKSDFFYAEPNQANKIKAPIDLLVQVSRLFNLRFIDQWGVTFLQRAMGQVLFDPPNVAGWQGGKSWINNSTLMLRLNLASYLVNNERFDHAVATPYEAMSANETVQNLRVDKDLTPLLDLFSGTPYAALADKAKKGILAGSSTVPLAGRRELRDLDFTKKTLLRLVSLPEFQMC